MPSNIIQYVGLNDLDSFEQDVVKRLSSEYFPKLKREVKNNMDLMVYIKIYSKGGDSKKYSVHARVVYATKGLKVDEFADWNLPKAMHGALRAMHDLIKSELKNDAQKYKKRASEQNSPRQAIRREMEVEHSKKKMTERRNAQKKRNSFS